MIPVSAEGGVLALERKVESVADVLFRLAGNARYYRAEDGRLHAQVSVENRREVLAIKSTEFREWLVEAYRSERGEFPAERSLVRVISSLERVARFDRGISTMQVRVARGSGRSGRGGVFCRPGRRQRPGGETQCRWMVGDQ